MAVKDVVHRVALGAERIGDRIKRRATRQRLAEGPPVLDPYRGFATPDGLILRGRILTAIRRTEPDPEASRWANVKQMAGLFFTDEVAGVRVVAPDLGATGESDEEGYVWMDVPHDGRAPGWSEVAVEIEGHPETRTAFPVLIPDPDAALGVISDIDDTMIHTGAYSLARNLWNTFTGSTLSREVFPDARRLMERLHAGRNPVFFVSSSPWNLHAFLVRVFDRGGLVRGPMMLRDYGLAQDKFVTSSHGHHKSGAIDAILDANPDLPFVLIGDTGQKDAFVYRDAIRRHGACAEGGRIAGVVLRQPGPGASVDSQEAMEAIRRAGIPVVTGRDYLGAADRLAEAGLPV